jgi:hypothetical protein
MKPRKLQKQFMALSGKERAKKSSKSMISYISSSSQSSSSQSSSSHSSSSSLTFLHLLNFCCILKHNDNGLSIVIRQLSTLETERHEPKGLFKDLLHNFRRQTRRWLIHISFHVGPTHIGRVVSGSDSSVNVNRNDSHGIVDLRHSPIN